LKNAFWLIVFKPGRRSIPFDFRLKKTPSDQPQNSIEWALLPPFDFASRFECFQTNG
jgi:hypothetical protein